MATQVRPRSCGYNGRMTADYTIRLVVHGRVQGVWFRVSAQREASSLGLDGWVRNRPDGTVEAVASGDRETVERFAAWCEAGPPGARVQKVERTPGRDADVAPGPGTGFHVRR